MQEDLKKDIFLLIDGSAIVHRAYHAMPSLNRSDGTPTGAVQGFFSMLMKLMGKIHPSHIAVAFDRPKPTFRQELYKEYQAQRPTTASDLSPQFGIIIEILGKAGIPVYSMDGFEADDIIGTLSYEAEKAGDLCYVVTGDRDMMQLVDARTRVLMPIKGISEMKLFDEARVIEQFGVPPDHIIELKALQGDPSDNYPGVAGVGPKTAANLISEFGSVKNIYKNLGKIQKDNPKLAERLENGQEHAALGHQLATILRNVPFEYSFKDCEVKNISYEGWKTALESYEFKTLPKRLDAAFGKTQNNNESGIKNKEKTSANQMKLL